LPRAVHLPLGLWRVLVQLDTTWYQAGLRKVGLAPVTGPASPGEDSEAALPGSVDRLFALFALFAPLGHQMTRSSGSGCRVIDEVAESRRSGASAWRGRGLPWHCAVVHARDCI
jgi:hypothetical protein